MTTSWMIYGANGYTGELIAREAVQRGQQPILAGRSRAKVEALAQELGLEFRVFSLQSPADFLAAIQDCQLILHCAGPFSATAAAMMNACLQAGAHYLDITGEISVFEYAHSLHQQAQEAGVVLCPGVGFDVIPTDCVAAALKRELPDATHLRLGFETSSSLSPGTAKTTVEGMALGGKIRKDGRIQTVALAHTHRRIDFGNGAKSAMPISWGDVATAYYSTQIPNIEVFIPLPLPLIWGAKLANLFRPLLALNSVQAFLKQQIGKHVQGPEATRRAKQPTYVWGEASNANGQSKVARVVTDNIYSLTISGALAVVDYLQAQRPPGGSYTPSALVGEELVSQLPGSGPIVISAP